jgi:PKD repeat protein
VRQTGVSGAFSLGFLRAHARREPSRRGQSLVEFALVLPVLMLLMLMAVDFGRVYLGYVNLQNMARVAANFAANNPEAWLGAGDTDTITKYRNQILADATATNCALNPTTPADPVFTDVDLNGSSVGLGDQVSVSFNCTFKVITPMIASIVGGNVTVSASSVFPVKSGQFKGGVVTAGPGASFTGTPRSIATGGSVQFTDASSGSPTTWSWTFGDGGTSSAQNPSHTYASAGTYSVSLTVTNGAGSNTVTQANYISVSAPPAANFTSNTTSGSAPLTVSFSDASTGSPTAWAWTFGDGGTSTQGPLVSHSYASAGTYTVSLTVTGPGGSSSVTKSGYIIVSSATCTVPDFVGKHTKINSAQGVWNNALFTTTVDQQAGHSSGNYTITFQSIVAGNVVACSSPITVNG